MNLRDKTVVLTGASRGVGVPIALALAERGADLLLVARDAQGLNATAERVRAAGRSARVLPADLLKAEDRQRIVEAAVEAGAVGLVNNAGIEITKAVADQSPHDIERQITVNLTAPILLTRALLPHLVPDPQGPWPWSRRCRASHPRPTTRSTQQPSTGSTGSPHPCASNSKVRGYTLAWCARASSRVPACGPTLDSPLRSPFERSPPSG